MLVILHVEVREKKIELQHRQRQASVAARQATRIQRATQTQHPIMIHQVTQTQQATLIQQATQTQQPLLTHQITQTTPQAILRHQATQTDQTLRKYEKPVTRIYFRVRFLNGSDEEKELVKSLVKKHVHTLGIPIRFKFMPNSYTGPSTIRIKFVSSGNSKSKVGLWAMDRNAHDTTMTLNLASTEDPARKQRSILHEFGHALGLQHQHQHPDSGIQWDEAALKRRVQRDKAIKSQYVDRIPCPVSEPYDKHSIMHYRVAVRDTLNLTKPVPRKYVFSKGDKARLKKMYSTKESILLHGSEIEIRTWVKPVSAA
ncbi:zincin [Apiospora aurea]|uniref:Metalloendopeptidase n=1 Tax=Apiospora aurea TaxID=335848 RepID=A0ABR1QSM2_9PEZI